MTFGHGLRPLWALERDMTFLNHGSYGATPVAVLQAQRTWQDRMEAQPLRFFLSTYGPALRQAAAAMAATLGAPARDLVFVENATTGVNAVLRSLNFAAGDRVLCLSQVYGAVQNALHYVTGRAGATLEHVPVPPPLSGPESVIQALSVALQRPCRLVVLDHITSATGLVLPIRELVAQCRARKVPVLVDGAHSIGMVPLELEALGADWFVGNAHKWLCAPKGCAVLYTRPERQAGTRPLTISHGYNQGYLEEFDFLGTRDISAWLAVTEALAFRQRLGGDLRVCSYNRGLAHLARDLLVKRLGATPAGPAQMMEGMAAVALPVAFGPPTRERAWALRDTLWREHRVEVAITALAGALWLRVSGQVYLEDQDMVHLVDVLEGLVPG